MLANWCGQIKGHIDAAAFANPVALHGFDLLRPVLKIIQIVEQLLGIVGNADKPLGNLFALYRAVTAPATAIDNLLIGQYSGIIGAPVNRAGFFGDQARFVRLGKKLLFPFVVAWLSGGQLSGPVNAKAQRL